MKIGDKLLNYCSDCYKSTNHKIIHFVKVAGSEEYNFSNFYSIVKCDGCDNISYRTEYIDYENHVEDEQGGWEYLTTIDTYPEVLKNHQKITEVYYFPTEIQSLYREAISALAAKCYLLTAIAFRTIIEAVCVDKSITARKVDGDDLGAKIDKLVINGFITRKEAERLHTIRFKGNDSVHEMAIPKPQQLFIVLDTIEHLLKNLYIIDREFKRKLAEDTVITNFEELRILLCEKILEHQLDESVSLGKLLEKSARRLSIKSKELENQLIEKIKSGEYKHLALGDIIPNQDPKRENVQMYIIKDLKFAFDDFGL